MPTYEYRCRSCGERLEVVQSFSDDPLTVCPKCDGELRKVFGNVGIVFKGGGFYKTDSRNSSSSTKPAGTETSHDGHEHSAETPSTPKPEPAPTTTAPAAGATTPSSPAPTTP